MLRMGASLGRATSGFSSSSASPFLNDLMPLATSPMMSEIFPLPPNTINTTAPTMIQCQIDRPPMARTSKFHVRRPKAARRGGNLGFRSRKNNQDGRHFRRLSARPRTQVRLQRSRAVKDKIRATAVKRRDRQARANLRCLALAPRPTLPLRAPRKPPAPHLREDPRHRQDPPHRTAAECRNPAADGRRKDRPPSVPQDPEDRRSPQARSE